MKFILSSILLVGAFVPSFAQNFEICDQRWHPQWEAKGKKRPQGYEGFKTQVKVGCKIKGGGTNKNCLDADKVQKYVNSFDCCKDFTMKVKYKMMNKSEIAGPDGAFKQKDMMAVTIGKENSFMRFDNEDITWPGNTAGAGIIEIGADRSIKHNIKVRTNTCTPGVYEIENQLTIKSDTNGNGTVFEPERKMKCGITKFVTVPETSRQNLDLCQGSKGPVEGPPVVISPPVVITPPPGTRPGPPPKNGSPKGSPKAENGSPKGSPKAENGSPKGSPKAENGSPKGSPKAENGSPKGSPKAENGSPKSPSARSKSPSISKGKGTDAPGTPIRRRTRNLK